MVQFSYGCHNKNSHQQGLPMGAHGLHREPDHQKLLMGNMLTCIDCAHLKQQSKKLWASAR